MSKLYKKYEKEALISISLVYRFFHIDNLGLDSNDFDRGFLISAESFVIIIFFYIEMMKTFETF